MKNKKRFSKLAAVALAATMLAGNATIVSAHEVEDTETVSVLRAELCPDCGIGHMSYSYTTWSDWVPDHKIPCTHFPVGEDVIFIRRREVTLKCNYCTSHSIRTQTQSKVECYGSPI